VLNLILETEGLTDLVFNGHGHGFARVNGSWRAVPSFESEEDLAAEARSLCAAGGRHIDLANPFADVQVSGLRVHAVLASGVSSKTLLSIRRHASTLVPLTSELQEIVEARKNFLISGATGSGKTTLLRSMLSKTADRIITIEDVGELELTSTSAVSLVTRQPNIEGRGEIGLEELFRQVLRMRPDRIVLGEIRGSEFGLMLQALNTGHAGSAATLHANSIDSVVPRLEGLGLLAGLGQDATRMLVATAIDYVIHLSPAGMRISKLVDLLG
jgi:pilus assembly protein CpaF